MADTKTCADVMMACARRLNDRHDVDWVSLGRFVQAMVDKMDGADAEQIADSVLTGMR